VITINGTTAKTALTGIIWRSGTDRMWISITRITSNNKLTGTGATNIRITISFTNGLHHQSRSGFLFRKWDGRGAEGHTRETRASSRTRLNFFGFFVRADGTSFKPSNAPRWSNEFKSRRAEKIILASGR
jgi:hypothetical protein